MPAGPTDSIVDVPGVMLGSRTVWRDEPDPPYGRGTARTGVTVVAPAQADDLFDAPVFAGAAVLNGAGEMIGITAIREWGVLETPIFLTSSMAIGRVYDAAVAELLPVISTDPDELVMPVVAECDDGFLNQGHPVQVEAADVRAALEDLHGAGRPPTAGVTGAGTGMVCHELKGGIGLASRVAEGAGAAVVGVLALTNHGRLRRLRIDGVPVGATLDAEGWGTRRGRAGSDRPAPEAGSCIVVVATNAPLLPHQLSRIARRAGLGLARAGSYAGHSSGDIFLAFSTAARLSRRSSRAPAAVKVAGDEAVDALLEATVDATEQAVIDSLVAAVDVAGRRGRSVRALPLERTVELLSDAGRNVALPGD